MTQHTPQPWPSPEYDNHGNGGFSEWWEIDGIARVYHERDANLIAAAPAMLEALKVMTERYCDLANSGDCGFWDPEKEEQVKQARSAIALATGEKE